MQDRKGGSDHCIGLVWSEGGSISLYDYLADCCKPYADKFTYYVNGSQCSALPLVFSAFRRQTGKDLVRIDDLFPEPLVVHGMVPESGRAAMVKRVGLSIIS